MNEKKKQVWFRADQAELVVRCLKFVNGKLNEDIASGAHAKVAGPFTYRRIAEVIELFEPAEPSAQ